jgi:hypothetical protein
MKTKGGFEIENFKILKNPIENHILESHIYGGDIIDFEYSSNTIIKRYYCTWDKFGRCTNWNRSDCFIDIKDINN